MSYTHYWNYKNPVLEFSYFHNIKIKLNTNILDEQKRQELIAQIIPEEILLIRIGKHLEAFKKTKIDLENILPKLQTDKKLILAGSNGENNPILDNMHICFNGRNLKSENSEDFNIKLLNNGGRAFDPSGYTFKCTTQKKNYDIAVCIALIIFKHYLGNEFEVRSDGKLEDGWSEAIQYYESFFNRDIPLDLKNYFFK